MRIVQMGPAEVQRCWPWLSQLLKPAVAVDPSGSLDTLHDMLLSGDMGLATVHVPNGAGVVVIHPCFLDGLYCLWLPYIAGQSKAGPKAWLKMMRGLMDHFSSLARKAGCAEVRIGGRDWSRVFPDFETFDPAHPNRLRKVL